MAACTGVLAVLGTFISLFIGSFDPWCCFLDVPFLLYLSSSDALHSLAVCCHLIFGLSPSVPLISVCIHLKAPNACVECMNLSYHLHA
jgi:hypothetical protein